MAWGNDGKEKKEFSYSEKGTGKIIDEKGSMFIKLSYIAWNTTPGDDIPDEKYKLDIRKYMTDSDGNERMGKGVSFLTEEGPTELVHSLLEEGYGDTYKSAKILKGRKDWVKSIKQLYGVEPTEKDGDDEIVDLRELLD